MTNVLRDSLGGNCKTTMIATINPEVEHTEESLSTCRFAKRVARVQNSAIVNEQTDPTVLIRQLKARVAALEAEVTFLKGGQVRWGSYERENMHFNSHWHYCRVRKKKLRPLKLNR